MNDNHTTAEEVADHMVVADVLSSTMMDAVKHFQFGSADILTIATLLSCRMAASVLMAKMLREGTDFRDDAVIDRLAKEHAATLTHMVETGIPVCLRRLVGEADARGVDFAKLREKRT